MAKKKKGTKPKQHRIPGTYDPVPDPVQHAADKYLEAKREKATWLAHMKEWQDELISQMRENELDRRVVIGRRVMVSTNSQGRIKVGDRVRVGGDMGTVQGTDFSTVRREVAERIARTGRYGIVTGPAVLVRFDGKLKQEWLPEDIVVLWARTRMN